MVGYKKPINKIIVAGFPLVQELKVDLAAGLLPGRFVIAGTTDKEINYAGAAAINVLGVVGYEQAHDAFKPVTVLTAFADDKFAPVLSGPIVVLIKLADSMTCSKGDKLITSGTTGEVETFTAAGAVEAVVAIAEEDGTAAAYILARLVS